MAVEVGVQPGIVGMLDVVNRAFGDDFAGGEHDDAVDDAAQRVEIVRDEEDRQAQLVAEEPQALIEAARGDRVEPRGRLVEEEHFGLECERPSHGRALAHAARELARHTRRRLGRQAGESEALPHQGLQKPRGDMAVLSQGSGDVLRDGQGGKERAVLEHDAEAAAQGIELALSSAPDVGAQYVNRAGRRALQADDDAQQNRLAASASADQGRDLASRHAEAHAVVHDLARELRVYPLYFDRVHRPTDCSHTANSASSRMTATMQRTTVEVVATPIERASRSTFIPARQPMTAIAAPNTTALPSPTATCWSASCECTR